jgi:prolipoprotein diacylglyceryl transferase
MRVFVWNLDPVLLRLGPIEIRYYGVCFLLALLGGFYWWRWQILRAGRDEETAERFLWPGVVAVIVGARLGHVLFYEWDRFRAHPVEILYFWKGGLASHGATVGLMLALYLYAKREKMPFWETADRFSFGAAWGAALVRVGNFMNSEIVGRRTDVAWGVKFPRFDLPLYDPAVPPSLIPTRHPSQIYEFFMGMAVLGALVWADKALGGEKRPRGVLALLFLTLYFTGRFLVEFFKEYQGLDPATHPLTEGQYLSIPFMIAGVVGLFLVWRKTRAARA